jgi:hypothetical protein
MYAARHSCSPMLNVEAKFGFRVCGQTAQQPPTAEFSIVATMENTTNRVDKPRQYLDRLIAAWYSCNPKPRPRTGTARRRFIIVLLGLCKRLDTLFGVNSKSVASIRKGEACPIGPRTWRHPRIPSSSIRHCTNYLYRQRH